MADADVLPAVARMNITYGNAMLETEP